MWIGVLVPCRYRFKYAVKLKEYTASDGGDFIR
jgi:hypothetical protein